MLALPLKLASLLIIFSTSACVYQYTDSDNNRHIIGLARISLPPDNTDACVNKTTVTSLGLQLVNLPSHGGVTLGYSQQSSVGIPLYTDVESLKNLEQGRKK